MEHNYIEFKKERDLGSILSDTFKFIRENWKSYYKALIKIIGPALIFGALSIVAYMFLVKDMLSSAQTDNFSGGSMAFYVIGILLFVIMFIVLYSLLYLSALLYMKSYVENKGNVDTSEIWSLAKKNFWKFILLFVLMLLIVVFSAVINIIPILGTIAFFVLIVFLYVPFSLTFPIMIFENREVTDAISQSFKIIKNQWWNTFGVLFVVALLVGILGQAFSIPVIIYYMIKLGTMMTDNDPTAMVGMFTDPIFLVLNLVSYVGKFLLAAITLVSSVFIYFDLNEQKNMTGTIEKIDSLGSR